MNTYERNKGLLTRIDEVLYKDGLLKDEDHPKYIYLSMDFYDVLRSGFSRCLTKKQEELMRELVFKGMKVIMVPNISDHIGLSRETQGVA